MAKYLINDTTLISIADAIRTKKGTTAPIPTNDFASEILSIQGGGGGTETKLYKFNDTIDENGSFETYERIDDIPEEDFQNGMKVNIMTMTVDTDVLSVPDGGLPAVFYPTYIGSDFTLYIHLEYEGEEIKSPFYIDLGNGDTHSDFSNTTFEIVNYGKYETWFKANISPVGGGECDKPHINVVDELPENGVEGAYYKTSKFSDVVLMTTDEGAGFLGSLVMYQLLCFTATQETLSEIQFGADDSVAVYLTDISEIYTNLAGGELTPLSEIFAGEVTFKGEISSIGTLEEGYYAYMGSGLYEYINGEYVPLFKRGNLIFSSNGDGTCSVTGIEANNDKNIVIPSVSPSGETVTSIGGMAFLYTLMESLVIPDTVTDIDSNALVAVKGLTNAVIGEGITEIGMAFSGCPSLETVTFPKTLESIDTWAFDGCYSLNNVTLPASLKNINGAAFKNCYSLENITFEGTVEQWKAVYLGYQPFAGIPATKVICSDGEVTL